MSDLPTILFPPHEAVVWAKVQPNRLDSLCSQGVDQDIFAIATQRPAVPVVLDLSNVDFLASLVLGALVSLSRRLEAAGHRFIIVGIHPKVRPAFTLTRLDKLFEIHACLDDALARLQERMAAGNTDTAPRASTTSVNASIQ